METYYDEEGKVLGKAWSTMVCWLGPGKEAEDHKPHVHNPQHAMYGPYMCSGFPQVKLFDTPPRKPVN